LRNICYHINDDFAKLSDEQRRDYTLRKEVLWESATATDAELAAKEVEMIRKYRSHDPAVGYNRWPKFTPERRDAIGESPRDAIGGELKLPRASEGGGGPA